MTTKELINQYVTAHADNRWMDASELEALLTEFAEKLNEPSSEDFEQAAESAVLSVFTGYADTNTPLRAEKIALVSRIFKAGALWQKKQMMKDAIDAHIIAIGQNAIVKEENEDELCKYLLSKFQDSDKVKVIIIKE